MPEN